jgi:hypothetical protein
VRAWVPGVLDQARAGQADAATRAGGWLAGRITSHGWGRTNAGHGAKGRPLVRVDRLPLDGTGGVGRAVHRRASPQDAGASVPAPGFKCATMMCWCRSTTSTTRRPTGPAATQSWVNYDAEAWANEQRRLGDDGTVFPQPEPARRAAAAQERLSPVYTPSPPQPTSVPRLRFVNNIGRGSQGSHQRS